LSSTTSPTSRIRMSRHVTRLVTRLVIDYFASRRLVVDNFAYAALSGASARRAARHAARRQLLHLTQACRRLLRLRCSSGCLGSSHGLSRKLVVDNFAYTARPGASARRAARHAARRGLLRLARLVVDYFAYAVRPGASARRAARHAARRRLLRLRRAPGCHGTSHGSSRGSSSTTSPTPRVREPRHVTRHVVNYFVYVACPTHHAARRRPHWLRAP
jgi:hypothetical protein